MYGCLGKVTEIAASSKLFSVAATETGQLFFWGRRPDNWRKAIVAARDGDSATDFKSWLGDGPNVAVDAMDEFFVW